MEFFSQCFEDIKTKQLEKTTQTAEMMETLLCPWRFFAVQGDQITPQSKTASEALKQDALRLHLLRYYQHTKQTALPAQQRNAMNIPSFALETPPNLYHLSSVICHQVDSNSSSGHFTTLTIENTLTNIQITEHNDD